MDRLMTKDVNNYTIQPRLTITYSPLQCSLTCYFYKTKQYPEVIYKMSSLVMTLYRDNTCYFFRWSNHILKIIQGDREMAEWVKCLLCKSKNLTLDTQFPYHTSYS